MEVKLNSPRLEKKNHFAWKMIACSERKKNSQLMEPLHIEEIDKKNMYPIGWSQQVSEP